MTTDIVQRIRRMYYALAQTKNNEVSKIVPLLHGLPIEFVWLVDFNQGKSEAELHDKAFNLIANIASIKDHLKLFCENRSKQFRGDDLIDTNLSVGLVHDLWNTDKHGALKKSRIGHFPRLRELRQSLRLTTGGEEGSFVSFQMSIDGTSKFEASGGGKSELVIDGVVEDRYGKRLGGFQEICETAIKEWENELSYSGVPFAVIP